MQTVDIEDVFTHIFAQIDSIEKTMRAAPYRGRHRDIREGMQQLKRIITYAIAQKNKRPWWAFWR
jgi:hypothetical protein